MHVACSSSGTMLDKLADDTRAQLVNHADTMNVDPGAYLLKQGNPDKRMFYVEEGRIKISVFLPGGFEKALILVEPGNFIGEVIAFDDEAYPVSAVALQPSRLLVWSFDTIHELADRHSDITHVFASSIAQKLRIMATQVESLATVTAFQRVADLFVHLAEVYGEPSEQGYRISLRLTQQELANMAGTSRVSVSNAFRKYKALGLVSRRRGRYYVHDMEGLRQEGSGAGDIRRLTDGTLIPQENAGP